LDNGLAVLREKKKKLNSPVNGEKSVQSFCPCVNPKKKREAKKDTGKKGEILKRQIAQEGKKLKLVEKGESQS
jgi:hypothetical protein